MSYNLLSFGIDIFDTYVIPINSKPVQLLDLSPANVVKVALKETETEFFSCEDRYELSEYFSAKASIKGNYNAFSGELNASVSGEFVDNGEYIISLANYQKSLSKYTISNLDPSYLSEGVQSDPDYIALTNLATPGDEKNLYLFYRFFEKFGAFFITSITFGGTLYYWTTIEKSFGYDKKSAEAQLQAEYNAVITSAKSDASAEWQKVDSVWKKNRKTRVKLTGATDIPDPSAGDNFNDIYTAWSQNLTDEVALGYTVEPISILFSGDLADAMNNAIASYAGTNMQLRCLQGNSQTNYPQGAILEVAGKQIPSPQNKTPGGGVQVAIVDRLTGQVTQTYNDQLSMTVPYRDTWTWAPVPGSMDRLYNFLTQYSGKTNLIVAINFWGIDGYSIPVSQEVYAYLTSIGASGGLDHWVGNLGQSLPEGNDFNYSIVGVSGMLKGQALESWSAAKEENSIVYSSTYLGVYLVPKSNSPGTIMLYPV